jgi:hypothetical protein
MHFPKFFSSNSEKIWKTRSKSFYSRKFSFGKYIPMFSLRGQKRKIGGIKEIWRVGREIFTDLSKTVTLQLGLCNNPIEFIQQY